MRVSYIGLFLVRSRILLILSVITRVGGRTGNPLEALSRVEFSSSSPHEQGDPHSTFIKLQIMYSTCKGGGAEIVHAANFQLHAPRWGQWLILRRVSNNVNKIVDDNSHVLAEHYELLPSDRRFRVPKSNTVLFCSRRHF